MKVVGLTGGIGSGKTTVAKMFKTLGVPIYISDVEAKKVIHQPIVKDKIITLLGSDSFKNDVYNTAFVASQVFENPSLLEQLNAIIHPHVASDFANWKKTQQAVYIIKESAILFETGSYKDFDKILLVTAPRFTRFQRVLQRENVSEKSILQTMNNQWSDSKKRKLADIIIENDGNIIDLEKKVAKTHNKLLKTWV